MTTPEAETAAMRAARRIGPADLDALDRGEATPAVAELQASLRALRAGCEASPVVWLAEVYRAHDRLREVGKVACRLAVIVPPGGGPVAFETIRAPLRLSKKDVREALDTLAAGGFIEVYSSSRVGEKEIRLIC